MTTYTVMTPRGYVDGEIEAPDAETAATLAEERFGVTVVDIQETILVVSDE
jgi:hypothetical protein